MADDTERLTILVEARVAQLEKQMQRANQITAGNFAKMRKASKDATDKMASDFESLGSKIQKSLAGLGGGKLGGIGDLLGGKMSTGSMLTVGFGVAAAGVGMFLKKSVEAGDTWNKIGNRLRVAGIAAGNLSAEQNRVAEMAMRSYASIDATADLYAKLIPLSRQFGRDSKDAATATEAVAKALSLGGVDKNTANSVILQLGQALGSGKLGGEELNALMEGLGSTSPLVQAIAREFGIATGQLKAYGAEGKLSSDRVFKAILASKPEIDRLAQNTIPTLGQAWINLETASTRAAATMGQGSGVAAFLSQSLAGLAQALDDASSAYDRWVKRTKPDAGDTLGQISVAAQQIAEAQRDIDSADQQGWSANDPRRLAMQARLDMWKQIAKALEEVAHAQSVANEKEREAANIERQKAGTEPSATDKAAVDDLRRREGIGLSDRDAKIIAEADKIEAALKKAGSTLTDAAMKLYANTEATKIVDAQASTQISADGVSAATKSYVDRVVKAESDGKTNAKNPNSSATGVGQFIERTWLGLFRKYYPQQAATMGRDAILELRKDSEISKRLIEAYAKENAETLQKAGVAVTEANLHLSHFLGVGDAVKVLKASPGTKLAGLINGDSIAANPSILGGGRTVDDAIAYANRRANSTRVAAGDLTPQEKQAKKSKELLDDSHDDTAKINQETQALSQNTYQKAFNAKQTELLNRAKKDGIELTPQLKASIDQEAAAYAKASAANKSTAESLQQINERRQWLGSELTNVFTGIISGSMSAADAVKRLADAFLEAAMQALLLGQGPLAGLFGMQAPAGGGVGGLLGGLFAGIGFSEGGYTGPGGKYEPAGIVHRGEYVIPADTVKRIGASRLEAIFSGKMPGYAAGGLVGSAGRGAGGFVGGMQPGPSINFAPTVNVQAAQGGDAKQNEDSAQRTARAVEQQLRSLVQDEMVRGLRPGGMLAAAARGAH